jgi:hypothetical protein
VVVLVPAGSDWDPSEGVFDAIWATGRFDLGTLSPFFFGYVAVDGMGRIDESEMRCFPRRISGFSELRIRR